MARGTSTLAERIARLEEAVRRLETMVANHLAHMHEVIAGHEERLRLLERERNHRHGRQSLLADLRWGLSLLLPALTGSLAALVLSRLW